MPPYDELRAYFDNSEALTNLARRAADIGSLCIAGAANDETFVRAGLRFGSAVASELAALAVVEDIAPV